MSVNWHLHVFIHVQSRMFQKLFFCSFHFLFCSFVASFLNVRIVIFVYARGCVCVLVCISIYACVYYSYPVYAVCML